MLRNLAAALFVLFAFISPSGAIEPIGPGQYTPVSDASAQGLTIPNGATVAVICAEGSNHRFTWDNQTTPTASVGTLLQQNSCMQLYDYAVMAAFKIIAVSAGGTFTVSYGKGKAQ